MTMKFLGKWTFGQGAQIVQINMGSGALSIGVPPTDGSDKFNAYGSTSAFILQGANGLYVTVSNAGYSAIKNRGDISSQFSLIQADAGAVRVLDLGTSGGESTQYYWNDDGGALERITKTDTPPATTLFTQTIVTVGLDTILQQGFASPQPDLTWVYLSGADFSEASGIIDFTQSIMTHADLSNTKFSDGTGFDHSTARYASFAGAQLDGCSIASIDFTHADFTEAKLTQATAENSVFDSAEMTSVNFKEVMNLAGATFIDAKLQNADFSSAGNIYDTDFTGADLTGASFTQASVTGSMKIERANLTDAALNNPGGAVTIYPNMIVLDSETNFTGAKLQYLDFSGYQLSGILFTQADMTGCKLDGADLTSTELSYAILDGASLTGTVRMNGANLSNASLVGADLTNAQLGALSSLFSVTSGTSNYATFLQALTAGDAQGVSSVFSANGYTLGGTVTIIPSRFSTATWTVEATSPSGTTYTVAQETVGGVDALGVYTPKTPAILANAFMVNVTLTGANLIGVNASGASIYGIANRNPNLNSALMQGAQFANANLGNADFSSANLAGVSFDFAILTNAVFQNAKLTTSADGERTSFVGANLQNASFDGATLNNVAFTNAAVGVANPSSPTTPAGVWLFSLSEADKKLIVGELDGASNTNPPAKPLGQFTLTLQALQQLQVPGPVGKGIVKGFADAGVTLTSDAVLTVMSQAIFWRLTDGSTQYVIFQSYDSTTYAPALGVAAGSDYRPSPQFTLPLSLQVDLMNGPVDAAVIAAFKEAGHTISATAQIAITQHPTDWQIVNGTPDYRIYAIWLGLDPSTGNATLTVRPALTNVIVAFNNASIALSIRATVQRIGSGGWAVSNDAENPYNPVKDYIIFNAIPNATTNGLDLFGSFMRIQRPKSLTESEYYNLPAGTTNVTQVQMAAPGNVCPNGDFASTNQINGLSYDKWLRARVAPRPPFCVPDPQGMYTCPR